MSKQTFFVEANGSRAQVQEVYESYTGWYWFITESDPEVSFGLVIGLEIEWGAIYMPELEDLISEGKVWKVPRSNWFSISHIHEEVKK